MAVRFTDSCAPISYPCQVGLKYIDPCTCRGYLECETGGYDFLKRRCGNGTAWNHNTGFCLSDDDIFIADGTPICRKEEPWRRCNSVDKHYPIEDLRDECDPGGSSDPDGGDPPSGSSSSGGDDNTGAIVGGILGAVVVVLVIVLLLVWWRKRQDKKGKDDRPSLPKRRKDRDYEDEEVYDVIDEKKQVTPISNAMYDSEKAVEYDNPAYVEPDNNYMGLSHQPQGHTGVTPGSEVSSSTRDGNQRVSDLDEDLSRSISVGGKDVQVQDQHGYHIGYPSGSIPRQPSPHLSVHKGNDGDDVTSAYYNLEDDSTYRNSDLHSVERTEL